MYTDLIASSAFLIVNKRLAEICGIEKAVYLSCIVDIVRKAANKKAYDPETGMIKLDRKYIQQQTTITPSKQREFDSGLDDLALLTVDSENKDKISVNSSKIVAMIMDNDITSLKEISKAMKALDKKPKQSTEEKAQFIIQMLKDAVNESDETVRTAYYLWIDSTYGKLNKKAQVVAFQDGINRYSADKDTQKEIINICTTRQYVDVSYAISIYENSRSTKQASKLGEQKIATKVGDREF